MTTSRTQLSLRDAGTCATRSWSLYSHLCANTLCSLILHLSLVLVLGRLCSLMEEQLNVQLPPGTTECNHSYYTGNSFSASHSVLQLQNDETANSVQPFTHTQQANGAASSGSVSSPPLPCSTISSQVPVCPIRNVTGDVMPLAQAITQLSFLEFLQHCGIPLAPLQPSQLPVPISLLDAAVQTNPVACLSMSLHRWVLA